MYTVQLKQCCEIKTWKDSGFLKYTVTAYFVVFFRYCRCVSIQSIFHRNSHMISLHAKQIKSQVTMGQKISSVYYKLLLKCAFSQYNLQCMLRLILMPTGRLWACQNRAKSHVICNLLTLNIKPWPWCIDLTISWSIWQCIGLRFSC